MTDTLELELRQLPGVRFVAFAESEGEVVVEVGLQPGSDAVWVRDEAARLTDRYLQGEIRLEVVLAPGDPLLVLPGASPDAPDAPGQAVQPDQPAQRDGPSVWRPPPPGRRAGRVRLVLALPVSAGASFEVHLAYRERTVMVVAPRDDLLAVVTAALDGLGRLGLPTPFAVEAVEAVDVELGDGYLVVLRNRSTGEVRRGLAAGLNPEESVTRAVLNALNRYLQPPGS